MNVYKTKNKATWNTCYLLCWSAIATADAEKHNKRTATFRCIFVLF